MIRSILVAAGALALAACSSSFQSAKVLAPGQTQVTGAMLRTTPHDDFAPEGGALYSGDLQIRRGITPTIDLGGRYVGGSQGHYLAVDPKIQVIPKYVSFGMPIGIILAEDNDGERMFDYGGLIFSPTVYIGSEISPNQAELVVAPKILIVVPDDGETDSEIGASVGMRLSSDLARWAIVPELSILNVSGEASSLLSFGVALQANTP
jgi:hypothetical protein